LGGGIVAVGGNGEKVSHTDGPFADKWLRL